MPQTKTQQKDKAGAKANGQGEKASARAAALKAKEEAQAKVRKEKIDSGDLVVTKTHEFETSEKAPASSKTVAKIIETFKKADGPLVFNEVATKLGAKYPEDLIVAMYALEHAGLVKRFHARSKAGNERRPRIGFQWVGPR